MKIWHAGLLGLTLTSSLAFSANAADVYRGGLKDGPPPPVYTAPPPLWTGFYIGVNGGYGESASDGYLSPSGGFGGGQIGYNWQGLFGASPWVLGIEADFQGAGISDSTSYYGDRYETNLNWFGTVRGRLGYAFGPALLYATGGFAYGDVEAKWTDGPYNYKASETQTGYTVGGGIEYKFNPAWSVKAEYLYLSLDPNWNGNVGSLDAYSDRSDLNTFKIGLNYSLGGGLVGPLH